MTRAVLALVLALVCGAAWADPVSLAAIAVNAAYAYGYIQSAVTVFWLTVAIAAVGAANQRRKARKVAAQQRAEYNASLQDRTVTVLRGDPPWQVVYGRCIVGGAIVDIVTSDKPGAHRDNGEIYTKADAYKHLVIVLAAHEVEAIHEVYIDGVAVGALDGSGWVTAGDFFTERTDARRVVFTDSTTPAEAPLEVLQAFSVEGVGESQSFIPRTVTISGGTTLVGPAGIEVWCDYLVQDDIQAVRISKHLGGAGQAVDAFLAAAAPTRYTAAHKLEGLAYIVVTLDLEDVRFQGGPPNITADVSGRLLYDPRTATTAWSANPALVLRDFLAAEWGYGADTATEIDDAYVIAAANACDELIDLHVGGTVTTGVPRYTCNGAFTTDAATEATLEDLAASMAGAVAYGGSWQVMAGAWTAPVMALTDDDLHGMVEVAQADTPMDDLANGIRGQYIASNSQTPTDFNPYQNATFLAADDGRELWLNVSLPYTDNVARARNLCRVLLEGNRAGQVLRYPAKLRAWPLQVGDRVTVTCADYGLTAKPYRVTDWQFDISAPVLLTLQEDVEEIYDLADAAVADPTPNTDLPNPWRVDGMAGVTATSGGSTLLLLADGSLLPRVRVAWTARTDAYVTEGGRIEVLWRRANQDETQQTAVSGSEIAAWIVGVDEGDLLLIEVRAVNSLGARSISTFVTHTVVGKEGNPADVAGLDWEIKPGQVWITWTPSDEVDYAATELRYGGTGWDDAAFLWRGKASDYQHPRPPNGTYVVRAKHLDTSGHYSTNAASITVTVDDSIDGGSSGTLSLTTDRFPYFSFADGTTHTASAPGDGVLTIRAALVGLSGTPTFTATARNSGGGSLGTVTLGGSGLVRTLTAAQFVSLGTSGSVRTMDITATLAGVNDTLTVYRQDSTTTAPRVYLSNPTHTVATDANGDGGDFTGAETDVQVYTGTTDATSSWSFAITADAGVTATINGGAGPVTGTASVTVAVSAMTVPDGAVLITASKTAETDLTATFAVTKNEATGAYQVYWDPRAEVLLPVGADGEVSSYADAFSSLVIESAGGVSDVANWAYSKVDTNVTSTLTANLVQVTGLPSLGTIGTATYTDISATLPSGWTRPAKVLWTGAGWVALGYHASTGHSKVQTSSDYATWATVDVGSSALWYDGAAGKGVVIAVGMSAISNDIIRSSDHGATWTADTHGSTMQAGSVAFLGSHFLIAQQGGTGGRISADGDTWSAITLPGSSCRVWGSTGRWLAETSSAAYHYSTDAGSSWAASTGLPAVSSYGAAMFRGRFVLLPNTGGSTSTFYYSDNGGASFAAGTLPQAFTGVGFFGVVSGVLYLIGADGKLQYTTDGVRWRYAGTSTTSSMSGSAFDGMNSVDMPIAYLPGLTTTSPYRYYKHPLLATSETEGAVTVTATKPGEADVVRALPVRRATPTAGGHAFFALPFGLVLAATSDGVVTDFSAATITAYAQLNGIDDTAAWSWSWTATNLTPSSGSTNTATFAAMNSAQDTGTVTFTAARAGYQNVTGTLLVRKAKGAEGSGPRIGAAYSVVDAANTLLGVRFNTDGSVDVKRGSGGSYTRFTQWAGAVVAGVGSSYWLYAAKRATNMDGTTGHALSTGTEGSWLALSSARTYEISDATSGTHLTEVDIAIGSSSTGANAVVGFFSLKLIVP